MRAATASRWLVLATLSAGLALAFASGFDRYLSIAALKAGRAALGESYATAPLTFVAGFIVLQAAALTLLLPGAVMVFALAAGAIFGTAAGTAIVLVAVTLGDSLGFLAARYLARDWVARRFARQHARFDAGMARGGAWNLLSLRLMAVVPFFVVNAALALTAMRLRVFAPVSFVGLFPATLIHVNAGTQLGRIDRASDVLSPPVLASLAALAIVPLLLQWAVGRWARARSVDQTLA